MPIGPRTSVAADSFASRIHSLHGEICRKLASSYDLCKPQFDFHRKLLELVSGNIVLVRIRPERLHLETVKKPHARRTGPYEILRWINDNAYQLDIPHDLGINLIFSVEDLTFFHEPSTI